MRHRSPPSWWWPRVVRSGSSISTTCCASARREAGLIGVHDQLVAVSAGGADTRAGGQVGAGHAPQRVAKPDAAAAFADWFFQNCSPADELLAALVEQRF